MLEVWPNHGNAGRRVALTKPVEPMMLYCNDNRRNLSKRQQNPHGFRDHLVVCHCVINHCVIHSRRNLSEAKGPKLAVVDHDMYFLFLFNRTTRNLVGDIRFSSKETTKSTPCESICLNAANLNLLNQDTYRCATLWGSSVGASQKSRGPQSEPPRLPRKPSLSNVSKLYRLLPPSPHS
jgi:hypothetical protein